ncbi:MAG: putative drug exporter of the superfamily [Frankiales bacterium]|jgi:RND superfamily putative drug exporter|nr:putative drug exporter of the superfamily [Frankiales bacterium]
MERLARVVMHHRRIVSVIWLTLFVGGLFSSAQLTNRWTFDFSLPGQPGDKAEHQLLDTYGVSSMNTYVAVVTVPTGTTVEANKSAVSKVFASAVRALPDVKLRLVDLASTGDHGFVTTDGRTTYALIQAPVATTFGPYIETQLDPALSESAAAQGFHSGLTGYGLLAAGDNSGGTGVLLEVLLAGAAALIVLLFVFGSFLALLPLLIAGVSILTTFMLVLALTTFADVSIIVQFLIALIGLGVALDYSLLLVSRWREERAHGRTNEDAVVVAMSTAGHAVVASGVTVAVSLLALLVVPVPALRSVGLAGLLIALVSVAAVVTLLPALLSSVGPRIDYPRLRHEGTASRGWTAWARTVVRHRVVATAVAGAILALLIIPVFGLKIGQTGVAALASNGPRYDALQTLVHGGVGTGVLTPIEVLVPANKAEQAADAAAGVKGVQLAVVGTTVGDSAVIDVLPTEPTVDNTSSALVDQVRSAVQDSAGVTVGVTGVGAGVGDYLRAVYDRLPYVLALIAVITFVLLVRTFRSVLLPLKAVLLNLISMSAVFGSVVLFWQQGHGSSAIFNVSATGTINNWLPVVIFAFLFGLSMDYEVFILSRMREEYDRTGDTNTAVVTGIGRTGRLVTSAALILFFAFSALASSPGTDGKIIGTALGVGILIDATVVRALLVPALVSLFGRWNWWLPGWLARALFVQPSPLRPRSDAGPQPELEPAALPVGAG